MTAHDRSGSDRLTTADRISVAVASCPAVAALSGGRFGEVATYLPGRRVPGVRITPTAVEVHVIARYGAPMTEVARQVRAAVAPVTGASPVDVVVDDLDLGDEADDDTVG